MSIPKGKKSLSARHIHMTAEKHKRTSVIKELEIERRDSRERFDARRRKENRRKYASQLQLKEYKFKRR